MEYKALHSKKTQSFWNMQALCLVFSEPFLAVLTKRKPDGVPPGFIYLKNKKFLISFPVFLVFPVSEAILCVTA